MSKPIFGYKSSFLQALALRWPCHAQLLQCWRRRRLYCSFPLDSHACSDICKQQVTRHITNPKQQVTRHITNPKQQVTRHITNPKQQVTRHITNPKQQVTRHITNPKRAAAATCGLSFGLCIQFVSHQ